MQRRCASPLLIGILALCIHVSGGKRVSPQVTFNDLNGDMPEQKRSVDLSSSMLRHFKTFSAEGQDRNDFETNFFMNAGLQDPSFLQEAEASEQGHAAVVQKRWPQEWIGKLSSAANVVGKGAFGKVYVGKVSCVESFHVAVKEMRCTQKELAQEWSLLDAFKESAYFIAPFGQASKTIKKGRKTMTYRYLMMEAVPGGTLTKVVEGKNRATDNNVLQLVSDILLGLRDMHAKNVIHRDLKPDNIMSTAACSEGCHAKIIDLGLACGLTSSGLPTGVPKCKGMGGTPLYIAPETWKDDSTHFKANDIWATGLIFYELHFKSLPRKIEHSRTMADLERNIKFFNVETDENFQGLPDGDIKTALKGMLRKDHKNRFTAEEALAALNFDSAQPPAVTALPDCFSKEPEEPTQDEGEEEEEQVTPGDTESFTLKFVSRQQGVRGAGYLFTDRLIDQNSGEVKPKWDKYYGDLVRTGSIQRGIELKTGDTIVAVNGKAWKSLGDKKELASGLEGNLVVDYIPA